MARNYTEYEFAKDWVSVTGVTSQVDKPFLPIWYGKLGLAEATRVNKNSKLIGALIDQEICHYFGEEPNDEEKTIKDAQELLRNEEESKSYYYQAIQNFHKFVDQYKPKSILGQQVVYSKIHKYIGTFDRLISVDKQIILCDWKATNFLSYEYKLQLEAYYTALTEMLLTGTIKIEGTISDELWIVQFPKKEEINFEKNVIKFKHSEKRFGNFLSLLNFYYGKKEDELEAKNLKAEIKKEKKKNGK